MKQRLRDLNSNFLLFFQNAPRLGSHAVDAPVGVAVAVADGDGEAAVVGPDHLDGGVGVALDRQLVALAAVGSFVLGSIRILSYEKKREKINC